MPIYTYACPHDDHDEFDVHCQMAKRNDPKPCPACSAMSPRAGVERVQDNRHKGDPRAMNNAALTRAGR